MYQRKLEKDIRCPLEYGMELFGGKWNSRIICVLAALGTLRYSELRRQMGNITDAVLALHTERADLQRHRGAEVLRRDPAPGGILPDGKGRIRGADLTEHLPMGGRILQGRGRSAHDPVPEVRPPLKERSNQHGLQL